MKKGIINKANRQTNKPGAMLPNRIMILTSDPLINLRLMELNRNNKLNYQQPAKISDNKIIFELTYILTINLN